MIIVAPNTIVSFPECGTISIAQPDTDVLCWYIKAGDVLLNPPLDYETVAKVFDALTHEAADGGLCLDYVAVVESQTGH